MSFKYTVSADGKLRTTIRMDHRLEKAEVIRIKRYLRERGKVFTDAAVREFVTGSYIFEAPDFDSWCEESGEEELS